MDTVSLPARRMVPLLLEVTPGGRRQEQALRLLAGWDLDLSATSAPGAIFEAWCVHIAGRVLRPLLGDELFEKSHRRKSEHQSGERPQGGEHQAFSQELDDEPAATCAKRPADGDFPAARHAARGTSALEVGIAPADPGHERRRRTRARHPRARGPRPDHHAR